MSVRCISVFSFGWGKFRFDFRIWGISQSIGLWSDGAAHTVEALPRWRGLLRPEAGLCRIPGRGCVLCSLSLVIPLSAKIILQILNFVFIFPFSTSFDIVCEVLFSY